MLVMLNKTTKNKKFRSQIYKRIWNTVSMYALLFCKAYVFNKGCLSKGGLFFSLQQRAVKMKINNKGLGCRQPV